MTAFVWPQKWGLSLAASTGGRLYAYHFERSRRDHECLLRRNVEVDG